MRLITERVLVMTESLVENAGKDVREDAFYSGYISAMKDIINADLSDIKEP